MRRVRLVIRCVAGFIALALLVLEAVALATGWQTGVRYETRHQVNGEDRQTERGLLFNGSVVIYGERGARTHPVMLGGDRLRGRLAAHGAAVVGDEAIAPVGVRNVRDRARRASSLRDGARRASSLLDRGCRRSSLLDRARRHPDRQAEQAPGHREGRVRQPQADQVIRLPRLRRPAASGAMPAS